MTPSATLSSKRTGNPWASIRGSLRTVPGITEPDDDVKCAAHTPAAQTGYKNSGMWSMVGLYAIMVFFAIRGHGFERAWTLFAGFFTADLAAIRSVGDTLTSLLPTVAAMLVIGMPLVMLVALGLKWQYGESKSHKLLEFFGGVKRHYMVMTLIVITEELFARELFLGIPLELAGGELPMPVIYVLFVLGNSIWALVHLSNFGDKAERQLLKVLPQFVMGIVFTVVYLNFGLVGSIIVHLAFNNLVMSVYRKGTFNHDEIAVIIWRSILLAASLGVLWFGYGKSLLELSHWFYGASFAVPGWEWQHYLLAVLAITSALTILGDLLLLDVLPEAVKAQKQIGHLVIVMGLSFGIFWILGWFGVPIDIQVLCMALVFLLSRRSGSANGMTRVFWIGLPSLMALLCAVLALGPESYFWLVILVVAAAELPDRYFRYRNAANDGYTV